MDTSVSSLKAIIILDENNKIIGHNDIALTISNQNILKDRPYHTVAIYPLFLYLFYALKFQCFYFRDL